MALVAVAAIAAVLGFIAQWVESQRGDELSAAKDDLIAEKDRQAAVNSQTKDVEIAAAKQAAGLADQRASEANKQAAEANESAARLQKEAAELRLELAKIDPINLPIRSIKVDVSLLVIGDFFEYAYPGTPNQPREMFGNIAIFDDRQALVMADCSSGETYAVTNSVGNEPAPAKPNARLFTLTFEWPGTSFFERIGGNNPKLRFWIEKNEVSIADFDKIVRFARLMVLGLKTDAKIDEGSCVVTINGSIQRRFVVPKTVGVDGQIRFIPELAKK